jgi:hypothetical protein
MTLRKRQAAKLLSVLAYEIMDSLRPFQRLPIPYRPVPKALNHTGTTGGRRPELGIETIRRRSEGLLKFAETYRNLTKSFHQPKESLSPGYVREPASADVAHTSTEC